MANVIIFTDVTPYDSKFGDKTYYFNFANYPAGAFAIASHLRRKGYSVLVIPHCLKLSLVGVKQIINNNSDGLLWVGISTTLTSSISSGVLEYRKEWATTNSTTVSYKVTYNKDPAPNILSPWFFDEYNLLGEFLQSFYNVPLLIGGSLITNIKDRGLFKKVLKNNVYLIKGNAEKSVEEITSWLVKSPGITIPDSIDNTEFDDNDFKNFGFLFTNTDLIESEDWLPIEIARGCAFNCAYCTYDRKSMRDTFKQSKALREEIIRNYEQWGVTKYRLMDDLYNDSKEKVRILYEEVWSKLPFKPEWASYMRLDMIWSDPDSAEILKNSGARIGSFGIETLHDVAGRKVGKGLGKNRIIEALTHLRKVWGQDVLINGLFIAGLPHEPEQSILETMNWLFTTDLLDSWLWHPLYVNPTESYQNHVNNANEITKNNSKFGVTWISPNIWKNESGMTFTRAIELSSLANSHPKNIIRNWATYSEWRRLGYSHSDLVNLNKDPAIASVMEKSFNAIEQDIDNKVKKFLSMGG